MNLISEKNKLNEELELLNNNNKDLKNENEKIILSNEDLNKDINLNNEKIVELNNKITKNETTINLYKSKKFFK